MLTIESHAARCDITAGPTRRHTQQFGVKQHARVIADADGQTFHRNVPAWKFASDARALKRKVLLQQTGTIRSMTRQDTEQTATRGEEAGCSFPWKGTSPKS